MPPPSTCKAITITSPGQAEVTTGPVPALRPDYLLVRTTAVALNPTDYKSIEGRMLGPAGSTALVGCRVGCDYAGVVEAVGGAVTKPFRPGDRVAGMAHGANLGVPEDGAFAEWIVVKGDLAVAVPDRLADVEAAALGVGISTVGQGLYQALGLPLPTAPSPSPIPVLIYGGSTATGLLGIQFAKASGCRVVTTSSARNAAYVRSLGADVVLDHHHAAASGDPDDADDGFVDSVRREVGDGLRLAWDCVGSRTSARRCVGALSKAEGGKYASLLGVDHELIARINPKVDGVATLAYTVFGEPFTKWMSFPGNPEDYEFAKMFWEMSNGLLAEGKIKPARQDVNRGGKGLEGVLKGLQEMREGKVSGVKLVYTL